MQFYVDTGSSMNIIDELIYDKLKQPLLLQNKDIKLFLYQGESNIKVEGIIRTKPLHRNNKADAEIFVLNLFIAF